MDVSLEPSNESFFLANDNIFAFRNCSGSFLGKWQGVWHGDFKLVDSFDYEISVNDKSFLLKEHCKKIEYSGFRNKSYYNLNPIKVEEMSFIPLKSNTLVSVLSISNKSDSPVNLTVNVIINVNHRLRETNWHDSKYSCIFEEHGKYITVKSSDSDLSLLGSLKEFNISFENAGVYNEYSDGNEKQRTFCPGKYSVSLEIPAKESVNVPFFFGVTHSGLRSILVNFLDMQEYYERYYKELTEHFRKVNKSFNVSLNNELEEFSSWSVKSIELLKHGSGLFAGLPWFTQFWGRDSFWSFNALLHTGQFSFAEKMIDFFIDNANKNPGEIPLGTIPNTINLNGNVDFNSIDATPLFVIALADFVKYTGDVLFLKRRRKFIDSLAQWFEQLNDNGFLRAFKIGKLTWMDTLNRDKAIEVQSLYTAACFSLSQIYDYLEVKDLKLFFNNLGESAKKNIDAYWNPLGYYKDEINSDVLTPNQLVALMHSLVPWQRAQNVLSRMLKEDMLTANGLRSLSSNSEKFFRDAYHQGSVWGLTTGWLVCALLRYGRVAEASSILEKWFKNLRTHAVGSLSETFTGEGTPSGCPSQLWNYALLIRSIDEFLFGIHPELPKNNITLSPNILKGVIQRFDKVVGDLFMDVKIEGYNNKAVISVYFSKKKPNLDLIIEPVGLNVQKMVVNGEIVEGNSFKAKDENIIELFF